MCHPPTSRGQCSHNWTGNRNRKRSQSCCGCAYTEVVQLQPRSCEITYTNMSSKLRDNEDSFEGPSALKEELNKKVHKHELVNV